MSTTPTLTLPATPEEMQRLLTDPTLLAPEPLRTLLRRCAVVASFDAPLFDAVLSRDLPAAAGAAPPADLFAALVSHPLIEALPTVAAAPPRYRLAASLQPQVFAAAWLTPSPAPGEPAGIQPALPLFSQTLADYYVDKDEYEHLYHLIAADQAAATAAFVLRYQRAESQFDLPRCHALLRIFDSRSELLGEAARLAVNQHRFRLDTRAQWATEYYSTALYYEREQTRGLLDGLLRGPQWLLHIYAPGGTGKSMFLRHLIARRCVPAQVPVGYVDFDHVLMPEVAAEQPWRLLVSLIAQIDPQIEGRPFGELLAGFAGYEHPVEARAIVQMRPLDTPPADEAQRRRDELIQRFASTLAEVHGEKPLIFIFDTLENLRQRRADLTTTFLLLRDLHAQCPGLRVILAGRYDLMEGDPGPHDDQTNAYHALFGDQQHMRLEAFTADEAQTYLAANRKITDSALVAAILLRARSEPNDDASRINPFKLSLLADLVAYAPDVTAATILAYAAADTAYLIERVVDRIEHRLVRFVLRYGVVPRFLTRDYLGAVLQPYLADVAAGRMPLDDPQQDALQAEILSRQPFGLKDQAGAAVDVAGIWRELTSFTSYHSWVTPAGADVVRFHPDVVGPMLRLLRTSRQPILQALHRDSADYCLQQAGQQPQQRNRWLSEAVYHRLAAGDAEALTFWQATWAGETGASAAAAPVTFAQETLALLEEPIVDPTVDPALAARQQDLRSSVASALAFAQLAELAPGELRRLLALAEAGDAAATQIAPADLALLRAQLDLREGRNSAAESAARQAIDDLGDRVSIGGVVLAKRVQSEATRILAAANVAQGVHGAAIAALRAALEQADPPERASILGELAALYTDQGDWIAAADACREQREAAIAQDDPLQAAAATTACLHLLTATGQEQAAAALAGGTQSWLEQRPEATERADQWRALWLAGRMAAEAQLAAQQPAAAQQELDRLAGHDGVQQFLKEATQTTTGAALLYDDLDLRARVAAACVDRDGVLRAYEQIAYDIRGLTPAQRARALQAAAAFCSDAGDFSQARRLLGGVASQNDDPRILFDSQLLDVQLSLAAGGADAAVQLAALPVGSATPPQQMEAARLQVLAAPDSAAAWSALADALAQLGSAAWRRTAVTGLAGCAAPAVQAARLRDLLLPPAAGAADFPLEQLRQAQAAALSGDRAATAAALAAAQEAAAAQQQWGVVRQVYATWDAVGWPDGARASAPLPSAADDNGAGIYLAGVVWLEHGLRLIQERADLAQGAELVERGGAALGPQSPWFARVLLGRTVVALAHGDDGAGRQLAENAAAAFDALGDAPTAQLARALIPAPADDAAAAKSTEPPRPETPEVIFAGSDASTELPPLPPLPPAPTGRRWWQRVANYVKLTLRAGRATGQTQPPADKVEPPTPVAPTVTTPLTVEMLITAGADGAWQAAARRGATTLEQWTLHADARLLEAVTLRSGEVVGAQFVAEFVKGWLAWATALGEMVTTPALRAQLTGSEAVVRWRLPASLAWLPWELIVLEGGKRRTPPTAYVLTPNCRYNYRGSETPRLAAPAPDGPVLVVRISETASRISQRGYAQSTAIDLVRLYRGASVPVYEVSENTRDNLERMVKELRPRAVHMVAGLVESGRRAGLNISGDTGMTKAAPRPLVAADLNQIFKDAGIAPLLILDPPAPPGASERVRQLCLRNAFAAEMAATGACRSILASGLGGTGPQETVARILVSGVATGEPLGEILRQLWAAPAATTELADLLPFAGAALFAAESEGIGDK